MEIWIVATFLAIVNNSQNIAIHMDIQIFVCIPDLYYFIKYPEMEFLYHMVVLCLIFEELSYCLD